MEKAYIECTRNEGEYVDEYVVAIPMSNGKIHSGTLGKEHFNKEGLLKTRILEDFGKKAIVLLPERMGQRETLTVRLESLHMAA